MFGNQGLREITATHRKSVAYDRSAGMDRALVPKQRTHPPEQAGGAADDRIHPGG